MQNCAGRLDKHTQNPEDDLPWEDVAEFREGDCDEAHVLSVSWRSAANQSIGEDMIMIMIYGRMYCHRRIASVRCTLLLTFQYLVTPHFLTTATTSTSTSFHLADI